MAEGREEVLEAAHAGLLTPSRRPNTAGQERWLGAGTLIERRVAERLSLGGSGSYWTVTRTVSYAPPAVGIRPAGGGSAGRSSGPSRCPPPGRCSSGGRPGSPKAPR